MTIGTRLYTMLNGERVGTDGQGNRYYRSRRTPAGGKERRWVLYEGAVEASRVPPAWHAWLHRTTDEVPEDGGGFRWDWQKEHAPNRTGTPEAYRPPGHTLMGGSRDRATGDYDPWRPD